MENVLVFGERIKAARKARGLSQDNLATAIGVANSTISRWEKGRQIPSADLLQKAADALDVSVDYLIGNEHVLTSTPAQDRRAIADAAANLRIPHPHEMARVRVLATGGKGVNWGNGTVNYDEFEYEMLIHDPEMARLSSLIGLNVEGDSMEPDINDGDIVIFMESPQDAELVLAGEIMVVYYNGRMIVRGILQKGKQITLISRNKEYGNIEVTPEDEFRICGRVVRIFRSWKPKPVI